MIRDTWLANTCEYRAERGVSHKVTGSPWYTDDSSVCSAGVHAGVISAEEGGKASVVIHAQSRVLAGAGIPNVAYDNGESLVPGETVTAIITPVVEPAGFGTVELISSESLTGTASDDWNTGEFGEFGEIAFAPEFSLRYTAPSLADLGCADHPGETFYGHVGVLADFSGDAGTRAHVDPLLGGQGWVGAAVPLDITCPEAASTPVPPDLADVTPPPTDTSPATHAPYRNPPLWALLAIVVVVGVAVVASPRMRLNRHAPQIDT